MRWIAPETTGPAALFEGAPCGFKTEGGRVLVSTQGGPVCILDESDTSQASAWKLLLSFAPVHPARLAVFLKAHFPLIPEPEVCEILGLKADYRGLADCREMQKLDPVSVKLAEAFDFPVHVLRLFSRLEAREELLLLFQERNVRKNIIREIIQDLYDLPSEKRNLASARMLEFSQGWQARSAVFPAEDLRDLVRMIRYPRSEELRRSIRTAVSRMNLPQGVQLEVPPDLENGKPRVSLEFSSRSDLTRLAEILTGSEFQAQAGVILDALQKRQSDS